MEELIMLLKQAREEKNLSLEDISAHTKIQKRYLDAFEENNFSIFAGEVYLKGTITNYAEAVGVNPREALELYGRLKGEGSEQKEETAVSAQEPAGEVKRQHIKQPPKRRKEHQGPSLSVGVVVLVIALIMGGIWYSYYHSRQNPEPDPDNGSITEPLPVDTEEEEEGEEEEGNSAEPEITGTVNLINTTGGATIYSAQGFTEIEINLEILEPCWIQLTIDGNEQFAPRTFQRGETLNYTADERATVRLGWPKGVKFTVNDIEIEENRDKTTAHNFVFDLNSSSR